MVDATTTADDDCEVTASVDHAEGVARLVIADVCEDGAWISMPAGVAPSLSNYR